MTAYVLHRLLIAGRMLRGDFISTQNDGKNRIDRRGSRSVRDDLKSP